MSFIGIDVGTSFIKGAVLELEEPRIAHVCRIPFPGALPGLPSSFDEIDPAEIVSAVRSAIDLLLPHAGDCSGLVLCNQMSSLVLADEEGQPLSNCIGWRDQRALAAHPSAGGSYYDALSQQITVEERHQLGNELRPGLPVSFLYCLAQEGRLPHGAIPASLGDFVIANLCHCAPTTEPTNASAHGVFNLQRLDWDHAVISRLGLENLHWPRLRGLGDVAGLLDIGGRSIPCYTPVADQPCALAGSFLKAEELWVNVSTGSQVSLLSPRLEFGDYRTRLTVDSHPYKTITHIPAGRSLDLLVNLLGELAAAEGAKLLDPWSYIARAATQVGETDLRVNLAFFLGPCGDHGEIANIREDNLTIGHLFRAAFANMAQNYHACALQLSPDRSWEELVFSGGLAQKLPLLRDLVSRQFGLGYRLAASSEDSLLGLLALALFVSDKASSFRQAMEQLEQSYSQRIEL